MWHEARKQERKIRGIMVNYKKRAERRRAFYEKMVRQCFECVQYMKENGLINRVFRVCICKKTVDVVHFAFYQKADPTTFLRIQGTNYKIHIDHQNTLSDDHINM